MGWFVRRELQGASSQADVFYPNALSLASGNLPCLDTGCAEQSGVQCQYVDQRRRRCQSAWCSRHSIVLHGGVYCRRHAGAVAALGTGANGAALPDLSNRAQSLVNWVASDLHDFVVELLNGMARPGEVLLRVPMVRIVSDRGRGRRYERSWKLADQTVVAVAVTVAVFEDDDAVVHIRVGSNVVATGVPPWIVQRQRGSQLEGEADKLKTGTFYQLLRVQIREAVNRDRELNQNVSRW